MHELNRRYLAFVEELIAESAPKRRVSPFAPWAPLAFWIFYLGVVLYLAERSLTRKAAHSGVSRSIADNGRPLLIRGR